MATLDVDVTAVSTPIFNLTRGGVVCEHTEIADRMLQRMRGLLGRRSLTAGEGLLLAPAPSVHTAFMRFPIDVVFLDRELRVLKLVERLRPWRTASARRARATLELATGQAAARGITVGDRLGLGTVADAALVAQPIKTTIVRDSVLLVSKDRRFTSVATALLTRRGYNVLRADRVAGVAELARQADAEVVVFDSGSWLTAAAREAAQIEMLNPRVGVVLVAEEREHALSAMPVLAKWGSFDELHSAIQRARPNRNRRASDGRG